jgi:DNA-binding response OmpR family regulator
VRILVIEDEAAIAANVCDFLESRGHVVDAAADGGIGTHLAVTAAFDARVLDLGLPRIDGLALCRRLREDAGRDTPVLLLTARDTLEDKLEGFGAGADDDLTKPFELREGDARLAALHKRRSGRVVPRELRHGSIVYDTSTLLGTVGGRPVQLPPTALRLLEALLAQPERVFSRAELQTAVWGDRLPASETLRSQMHILGRAFAAAGAADSGENRHGVGHRRAAAAARCEMARAQRRVDPACRRVRHRARDRETHCRSLRLEDRGRK